MIGFHGQRPIPNWLDAVKILPAGAPLLAVNDLHMLKDAKAVNPGLLTIFRKKVDVQNFTPDYAAAKEKARAYFNTFIDGTWQDQELWRYVDIIKDWNEYVASSDSEDQRQLVITWLQAITTVWNTEYRGKPITGGRDIPLALLSVPIGNDIDPRYAQIAESSDCILSYHNYTHFDNGERDPLDWRYHSGRWSYMDQDFKARGITVKWISTEGGPYQGVYDGWKSAKVVGGSLSRYLEECIKYQIDNVAAWNKANGGRFLGSVLFTFGNTGAWGMYELNAGEMTEIAKAVKDYAPAAPEPPDPPEPPPGDPWKIELWDESVRRQALALNPNAALQAAIFKDDYVPVGSEFYYTAADGIQRAAQAAESLETGDRRVYYAIVPKWNEVRYFTDPKV